MHIDRGRWHPLGLVDDQSRQQATQLIQGPQALNQLFTRKQGITEVRLRLEKSRDFSVILDVATKVRPDKEFRAEVERICGPESVEVLAG